MPFLNTCVLQIGTCRKVQIVLESLLHITPHCCKQIELWVFFRVEGFDIGGLGEARKTMHAAPTTHGGKLSSMRATPHISP